MKYFERVSKSIPLFWFRFFCTAFFLVGVVQLIHPVSLTSDVIFQVTFFRLLVVNGNLKLRKIIINGLKIGENYEILILTQGLLASEWSFVDGKK